MRSALPAAVAALALAGCAAPSTPAVAPLPAEAPPLAPPRECGPDQEPGWLASSGGRATREGGVLRIRGDDGAVLPLEDRPAAEFDAGAVAFRYCGPVPELDAHLVRVGFYEGGSWVLVDAGSTNQTHLIGPPVTSPNRTRFVSANLELEAGYEPNGVEVWSHGPHGPRLLWGIRGGDVWGASAPVWLDEDRLRFTLHRAASAEGPAREVAMLLQLGGEGIALTPLR